MPLPNFKLQEKIKTLSKQKTRKEMETLLYQWVKTNHITCKEYLDLSEWVCENSSIVKRYEGDYE